MMCWKYHLPPALILACSAMLLQSYHLVSSPSLPFLIPLSCLPSSSNPFTPSLLLSTAQTQYHLSYPPSTIPISPYPFPPSPTPTPTHTPTPTLSLTPLDMLCGIVKRHHGAAGGSEGMLLCCCPRHHTGTYSLHFYHSRESLIILIAFSVYLHDSQESLIIVIEEVMLFMTTFNKHHTGACYGTNILKALFFCFSWCPGPSFITLFFPLLVSFTFLTLLCPSTSSPLCLFSLSSSSPPSLLYLFPSTLTLPHIPRPSLTIPLHYPVSLSSLIFFFPSFPPFLEGYQTRSRPCNSKDFSHNKSARSNRTS